MNEKRTIWLLVVIALILATCALASYSPTVKVSDGKVSIGETTTLNITLSEAPYGLSGYNLSIALSNTSIAELKSVSFSEWVVLHSNSSLPADSVWIKCVDLNDQIKSGATNITLATVAIKGLARGKSEIYITVTRIDDDNGEPINVSTISGLLEVATICFDTGPGTYPSISGIHKGTLKLNKTIEVSKLYTYPCAGTGGHTEYAKIYNESWSIETSPWVGYTGDWHNISFTDSFKLSANVEYNYTIITGSYPQIHHNTALLTTNGWINCTEFVDANGKKYDDWIPAIKLE